MPTPLERHSEPVSVCADPGCPGWKLSESEHFDSHNPPCAHYSVGHDGTEVICELAAGHEGPCRGVARRPDPAG